MRKFEIPETEFLPLRLVAEKLLAHQHVDKVEQYHALVNAAQAGVEVDSMTAETSNAREWPPQDWRGMDGETAYMLINRHANNWNDVREMMGAWLAANAAPPPAAARGDVRGLVATWRGSRMPDATDPFDAGCNYTLTHCADQLEAALAAEGVQAEPKPDARGVVDGIVLAIAELPDRNSPEDWPEAMLVTADELTRIVGAALTESRNG